MVVRQQAPPLPPPPPPLVEGHQGARDVERPGGRVQVQHPLVRRAGELLSDARRRGRAHPSRQGAIVVRLVPVAVALHALEAIRSCVLLVAHLPSRARPPEQALRGGADVADDVVKGDVHHPVRKVGGPGRSDSAIVDLHLVLEELREVPVDEFAMRLLLELGAARLPRPHLERGHFAGELVVAEANDDQCEAARLRRREERLWGCEERRRVLLLMLLQCNVLWLHVNINR